SELLRLARADGVADGAEEGGHLLDEGGVISETRRMINLGELGHRRRQVGGGERGGEFERRLRRSLPPAALFEQAQHLAVLEGGERGGQVSAAAGGQSEAGEAVGEHK